MRKIFFALTTFFILTNAYSQYTEINGQAASQLITNATFIRFNTQLNLPNYVEYLPNTPFDQQVVSQDILKFLKSESNNHELVLINTETDQLGWIHYRYYQSYKQTKVQGSMIIIHTLNGQIKSWNGEYYGGLSAVSSNKLEESIALSKALASYPSEMYMWENPENEQFIQLEQNDPKATFKPHGELVYKSLPNKPTSFKLCWKFNVYSQTPLKRANIYIDAATGVVIDSEDLIHTGNVVGTATTKYSGTRQINTDSVSPNSYRLRQTVLGKGVETYNLQKGTSYGGSVDFTDADNNWNNVNANKDEVATDAHFGAEQTYIFYKNSFGRKSYDNNDTKLRSYVHYSSNYDNAFWDGQRMTYGDGNSLKPLTCIDVAAHEMSHGVTGNSSQLVYNGESGALNESFSDIFGTAVEFKVKGTNFNYAIGEDITTGGNGIRSMSNPSLFGDPGAYLDNNWYTGNLDNGGVHTNSGVQNHWFYIISKGDKATNFKGNAYDVRGLGIDTAAAIAYRNNAFYLTPNSKYADSRFYSIQAAKDLYGKCSDAVKQCTNAWYAVNVGAKYDTAVKADFYANPTIYCSKNDSALFFNSSSSSATYSWNFGDGGTSTLENPKHKYANYGTYNIKLSIVGCNGKTDTLTKIGYIQVDSSLNYCKAFKLPASGNGGTFTACKGTLKDNGGDNNYSDQSDGYVVLAPSNASYIKFTFNQFNMENPGDYLYLYEGNGTGGKLIGQYSGNTLPNNGTIYSSTGVVTVRQVSDQTLNYSGFVMDWECIQKVAIDGGVTKINNVNGRENTSIALKSNEVVTVDIKNFGNNTLSNFTVKYQINGGSIVSETYTGSITSGNTATYTFTQKADLSTARYYFIDAWTEITGDSINTQNNKTSKIIKHIKNQPLQLPYFQGFEANAAFGQFEGMIGLDSTSEYDYFNTRTGSGRIRTNAGAGFYNGGQRAITFDQLPATNANGPFNTNLLRLTVNLANQKNDVYLDFAFMNHGDESVGNDSDKVWVRGNDQAAWVQVYNMMNNTVGNYNNITKINLTQALKTAGQTMGASMQVLFGQKNNGTATTPSSNDGLTIDDISLWQDVRDIGIAQMTQPKSGCGLTNAEQVKVDVFNYGTDITNKSGTINMKLNNGNVISQNVNFNILRNSTQSFTFTQTVDLSAPGTYTIQTWTSLTGDADSTNDSLTEQISVGPAMTSLTITASGPTALCFGDSVTLTANSGYTSYLWSNGKTTPSITVKTASNYLCTVTNNIGCKLSKNQSVTLSYKPIAGFNWYVSNNTVSFTNLTANGLSYKWYFGDGDSSTATSPNHTYSAMGVYNVQLYAYNACGTSVDKHDVNIKNIGIKNIATEAIKITPNPFHQSFNIWLTDASMHYIKLLDISGRVVKEIATKEQNILMEVPELAAGIYILQIDGVHTHKLVKE